MHEALRLAWHKANMTPHTCTAHARGKVMTGEWNTQGYPQLDIVWGQPETLSREKKKVPKTENNFLTNQDRIPKCTTNLVNIMNKFLQNRSTRAEQKAREEDTFSSSLAARVYP